MTEQVRVVIDVQALQNPFHPERGIARYTAEQARALVEQSLDSIHIFALNPRLGVSSSVEPLLLSGKLEWNSPEGPGGRPIDGRFVYYATSLFEADLSIDDVWPRYARRPDVLTAVTVYDLIPLIYADQYLVDPAFRKRYQARLEFIRHADLVLTISEATAKDVVRLLDVAPHQVKSIGAGVSDVWVPPADREVAFRQAQAAVPSLRRGFIMYTGGIDYRKNMEGILASYSLLPNHLRGAHQLVLTCKMDPAGEMALRELVDRLGVERDVLLTNYVPDATLLALYQSTHLFVFPSLYEGFGLPLVEAMRSGAPSIASDRSSLSEIVTDPEHRFDPEDTASVAAALRRGLEDEEFRRDLQKESDNFQERFAWSEVAEKTAVNLRELWEQDLVAKLPAKRARGETKRSRLAVFGPMPPQASGVADYTSRLISEMADWVDVDVFVDGPPAYFLQPEHESVELRHQASFRFLDTLDPYDEVLYCMGNSEFHGYIFDALRARPGVVLAHEVRFTGFYAWYGAYRSRRPGFFAQSLASQHPMVPTKLSERGWLSPDEAERFGVYLVSELIDRSRGFLVHSRYAAEIARLESKSADGRIYVVPFGITDPAEETPHLSAHGHPIVVTFGLAAEVKKIDAFVRAIPNVLEAIPDARFAIVGDFSPPQYQRRMEELAETLGVSGELTLTGYVDPEEYESWLRRATCAVQLRATTNGETSAAVADCLRHGIPTIVTAIGAAREYPPGTVLPLSLGASPKDVADAVLNISTDGELADELSRKALEFVQSSSFESAAQAVFERILPGVMRSVESSR